MRFHADLHVHSKYSRATSRDLDLEHPPHGRAARASVSSPPATSPIPPGAPSSSKSWSPPSPASTACATTSSRRWRRRCRPCRTPVRFMLEVEISTIYKKGDRTRKVHHLIYAPDFDTVDRMSARLARIGNIASDGRLILGLDSRDLLEIVLEAGPHAYLVPAHIWTPWFAALGSQSGFDSIVDCYGDLADRIFAVETGLSSDPAMNWRVSFLDRYRLISSSDAHSPGKLGREATLFECERDYFAIKHALESGHGYVGTVEFFPEEGKAPSRRPPQMRGAALSEGDARPWRPLSGLRPAADDRGRAPGRGARRPQRSTGSAAADRRRGLEPGAAARDPFRAHRHRHGLARGARTPTTRRSPSWAPSSPSCSRCRSRTSPMPARRSSRKRSRACAAAMSSAMPAMTANTASSACSRRTSSGG